MDYQLDRNKLRDAYYQKLIGIVIGETTDQPARLCGSLAHKIGVTFDSQRAHLEAQPPSYMTAMMESLMDSVENGVENYYVQRAGKIRTSPEQVQFAYEAAVEEMDAEDGGSTLADVLSDFLSSMQNFSPAQVKDMAKYVLELEQENQNQEKDAALAENDEIEENTDTDEDPFGEGGEDKDANAEDGQENNDSNDFESGSDGSDPFGGSSDSTGGDDKSTDDQDPFGEGSSEGNPFGDEGEETSAESGSNEGSEENNSEEQNNDNGDEAANDPSSENPFESVQEVSLFALKNGRRPFIGLENGDISIFCRIATEDIFKDKMKNAFDQFGVESAEYQDLVSKYKKTNRVLMESVIATVGMCALLGLKPNMNMIKYPDLYEEEFKDR